MDDTFERLKLDYIRQLEQANSPVSTQRCPLVSIGLPVYNEETHLRQVLDSLLAQDYGNFEIVISDNASTDGTALICEEYLLNDKRIRYYRNETNLGSITNSLRVFDLACGELFMFASGHDLYHDTFISTCAEVLSQDSSIVLCYPQTLCIDVNGKPLELVLDRLDTRGVVSRSSRLNMVLWGLTTMFPVCGLLRARALRLTRRPKWVAAPDLALLVELSLLGTFAHIPRPLFYPRRLLDHDSWEVYLQKHHLHNGGIWSAQMLFWRMVFDMIRSVTRHMESFSGKLVGILSVLLCALSKYRWILFGLLSVRRAHREDGRMKAS